MDFQSKDQTQKRFINKYQFLKRTLQFAFPVTVFSFFVWYCSGFSILPQSFNAYFSTCLLSMFTHGLERKYMFLICNGILAFLAKSSGSPKNSSPPVSALDIELQASKEPVPEEVAVSSLRSFGCPENAPLTGEEEEEEVLEQLKGQEENCEEVSEDEQQEGDDTLHTEIEGRENEASIAEEEEVKGEEDEERGTGSDGSMMVTRDDEQYADTAMATNEELTINTDELNRKFEEFIRKMKEEIRIEAQRQLIAV